MKSDGALFAQAYAHGQEAFIGVDTYGGIFEWNPAAERLFGYPTAEALGRPVALLCFPEESAALAAVVGSGGGPFEDRIQRLRHKSGREVQVLLRQLPLAESAGPTCRLLSAVDVGERQRAEEHLQGSRVALAASRSELRRIAKRRVAAEEEARRRVARELHDDLCQRVTAAALGLKAVRRQIPEGEAPRSDLDAVGGQLAELAEDLRRLSHDLHPAALERRGLVAALSDHCAEVERRTGLAVRLSLSNTEVPIDADVALGLYRIAQEALANVARHAEARAVHVTLTVIEGSAHLAIADDGVGFDPTAARGSGGLGLASIEERAELLGGQCRIASAPGAGTEIEVTVPRVAEAGGPEPETAAGGLPRRLGPYRLLEVIGRGAATTVYLAQEPEPLGRKVAIKLHNSPLPGRPETLRFKAEQQALARLHHPAIAEVYEARTTPEGDPYTVMEYFPGLAITEYCDRYALDLERRLELFATICGGVQHAHQKGILHRALEPSNLRVMEDGGIARPKILHFGAAKGLDRPLAEGSVWTTKELMGDLAYLAPEALGGDGDVRSEVYSLGAVLYHLLVGAPPIEIGKGGIAAWLEPDAVRPAVPVPSRRLRQLAPDAAAEVARRRGQRSAARLYRQLHGDLDRVVAQALAGDPQERYPTVEALGREISRVLSAEPVEAGAQGALTRLARLVRRHRRIAVSASLVILLLFVGLFASAREARRAAEEVSRADAVAQFLESLFQAANPRLAKGAPPDVRDLLRRGAERLGTALHDQPLLRARLLDTLGGIDTELGLYSQARPLLAEALKIRERQRGPDHPEVASTLVRLGTLAHLSGQGDAVPLFRRALAIREQRLGIEAPEVADVLNKLGVAFAARGKLAEAEKTLERSLGLTERLWGPDDPRVAKLLHNLSGIALYRGDPAAGERLLERALAIREKALAPDDLDLAGSREALALLRLDQGRPAEAEALLIRLVATAERVYGPNHPDFARPLLNLGLAERDLGEDAAATRRFESALGIFERTVAPDHPLIVRALATLADQHFAHRRYAQAEPLYRRLAELSKAGAVPTTWNEPLDRFARLLRITGREPEAAEVPATSGSAREE